MPKTDGFLTKENILRVAETLFSENGYDATSVDLIAKKASVNKATIYYHFKDKEDILISLFREVIIEMKRHLSKVDSKTINISNVKNHLKDEISFMESKREILAILIMESIKKKDNAKTLFTIAKEIIDNETKTIACNKENLNEFDFQRYFIHEFFTGFMPIVNFVLYKKKWGEFFNYYQNDLTDMFLDAFMKSHMSAHFEQ